MDIERSNGDDDNDEDEEEVVGGFDVESSTLTLPMDDEDVVSLCFTANFVKGSFAVVVVGGVAADAIAVGLLVK